MTYQVIKPEHFQKFTDTEGGTDLVVTNPSPDHVGDYTLANGGRTAEHHQIGPSGQHVYEVDDRLSAILTNTGPVDLGARFGGEGA